MSTMNTIGGLHDALSKLPAKARVFIDGRPPTALSSYRGYYDQLAIERSEHWKFERTELDSLDEPFEMNMAGYGVYSPGHGEVRIAHPATVAELRKALSLADGAVFEGYKGGQFPMRSYTTLWVSEHGQCDQLQIVSLTFHKNEKSVDLTTTEVDW